MYKRATLAEFCDILKYRKERAVARIRRNKVSKKFLQGRLSSEISGGREWNVEFLEEKKSKK
jgi:hypothetical protein